MSPAQAGAAHRRPTSHHRLAPPERRRQTAISWVLVATLALVALTTLTPAGTGWTWADPGTEITWYLTGLDDDSTLFQLLGNLLLLAPTAALAAIRWPGLHRLAPLLVGCLLVAIGIEVLQYLLPLGRVVSVVDIGLNTAGAVPALIAAALLRRRP